MNKHLIDIYNDKYQYIGVAEKNVAHSTGLWHRVFTCLVINSENNKVFLQKKLPGRYEFERPDYLDISVGGHYKYGELIEQGVRELHEELGVKVPFNQLIPLGIRQTSATLGPNYINNEFQHIFLLDINYSLKDFYLSDSELSGLVEIDLSEVIALLTGKCNSLKAKGMFVTDPAKLEFSDISISIQDFVPSYLEIDQFYLRLFLAAKRYIATKNTDVILLW